MIHTGIAAAEEMTAAITKKRKFFLNCIVSKGLLERSASDDW